MNPWGRKMSNFKFCVYDVSMIVYDVYRQEMMFKVIPIANKLPKHQKNIEKYVIFQKNFENIFSLSISSNTY